MMSFHTTRRRTDLEDVASNMSQGVAEALLGLAEELAEEARARVLENRDPRRPLPSRLADSISVETADGEAVVRAAAPHAAFVEFGTRHVPARPFLGPATARLRGDIAARLAGVVRQLLTRAGI